MPLRSGRPTELETAAIEAAERLQHGVNLFERTIRDVTTGNAELDDPITLTVFVLVMADMQNALRLLESKGAPTRPQ